MESSFLIKQENSNMKKIDTQNQKNLKKKKYEKPAIMYATKIETLAGTCMQTSGQSCVPAFN
jgi:hypothetical protein